MRPPPRSGAIWRSRTASSRKNTAPRFASPRPGPSISRPPWSTPPITWHAPPPYSAPTRSSAVFATCTPSRSRSRAATPITRMLERRYWQPGSTPRQRRDEDAGKEKPCKQAASSLAASFPVVLSSDQRGFFLEARRRDELRSALGFQQSDDLGVGPRPAEQKALPLVAALGAQAAQLGFGLDAFGGNGDAEADAEADDRAHDRLCVPIGGKAAHERLIDLDLVEREASELTQAGIAGAEIVHR